jgi:Replication factor-A C terminal domain
VRTAIRLGTRLNIGAFAAKLEPTGLIVPSSYLLGMQVSDHTTQAWLQAFNDVGAEIIGMSADKLMEIKVGVLPDIGDEA